MKRLLIAAPTSGTGKTSISLGLMRAFKNRGLTVQPYKAGPDYIDSAFHTKACGRFSRNLDLWMLEPEVLKQLFCKNAEGSDLCLVEGVMGLYDGLGHDFDNGSSAHLARVLDAPVVLVIDGRGVSTSAAALVKGFKELDSRVNLAGVIINQVSGERHYQLIREAIESLTQVRCYGYVEKNSAISLESRHLGLIPSIETEDLERKLELLALSMTKTVDLPGLLKLSERASPMAALPFAAPAGHYPVRIGLARDEAFNFYYEDNLDLLRIYGVEWVPFSPIHDAVLPEGLGGIYIGGGFPEVFAEQLSQNTTMLSSIRQAAQSGIPLFAECGGYMYLMEAIRDFEGRIHSMTGILTGTAAMTKRLQRFGYVSVTLASDSLFGPAGTTLRGHEFHRSIREASQDTPSQAYEVVKASPPHESWSCGENTGNVLAAYAHIHWISNPLAALSFAKACYDYGLRVQIGRSTND